jgi:Protein of unknown function (DUF2889)
MPLPPPAAPRQPLHARRIECRGWRRQDGLWEVEGHMVDVKDYGFDSDDRGHVAAGEPVHDMWLRLTLDDRLTILAAEAATDSAPFGICGDIAPAFSRLVGLRLGKGFGAKVRERLGGVAGCTHLVELTGPVATTAFQTVMPILARERRERGEASGPGGLLDSCHAFARGGPIVRRIWPDAADGG